MKLINTKSKKGVVNLFADYILNKFDKSLNTVIEVYNFNHFFIVEGRTQSNEVLDLSKIRDEFVSEYKDIITSVGIGETINIMDLIKYDDKKLENKSFFCHEYFDSERPIYHHKILNYEFQNSEIYSVDYDLRYRFESDFDFVDGTNINYNTSLNVKSEFPHGFSLSMGRGLMYYGEYICFNVKNSFISQKITLFICEFKDQEGEQFINVLENNEQNDELKSLILDNFDFNFEMFNKKIMEYNFCDDIKKPTSEKLWLVKDINYKDLIII